MNISLGPSWMDEIVAYLKNDTMPPDKKEAHRLWCKAALYWLSPEGKLYRCSFTGPYLLVAHPTQTQQILTELHSGQKRRAEFFVKSFLVPLTMTLRM